MSGSADQRLSIRLSFEGAQEARAQLEQLGQAGDAAMRKLETGGQTASRGVASVTEAGNALRAGLSQINGDLAVTSRQFEALANSTLALATSIRGGVGLAGAIGLVATAATAAYEIFKNWDSISGKFASAIDSLTGRYRDNATELGKVNEVLQEFTRLSQSAAETGIRAQIRTLEALATAGQASRQALGGEITSIQGEIDRRIGLTEARLNAARRGPGGAALSEESERILQLEIDRVRERSANNPEILRLQAEIAQRRGAIGDLDARLRFLQGQIGALNEATGSVLTAPPGEGGGGRGNNRATRAEINEAEREYQRLVQQGISLASSAASEQERYAQQVLALDAALGAARITQEQYNRAVAALDPAARAAREAQEQAARQAEQFARRSRDALAQVGETAMDRIGTGLVNAFLMGNKAALNFRNVMRGVVASLAADLLKLAVVTPITNAIFGTMRPTLFGAFGSEGFFGFAAGNLTPANGGQTGMASGQSGAANAGAGAGGISSYGGLFGGLAGNQIASSSIWSTPIYTAPATAPAGSLTAAEAASSAYYGEAAAAGAATQAGPTVTLGGAAAGVGGGFLLGSIAGNMIGDSRGGSTGPNVSAGAGAGAIIGAIIGSIIPGIGTVIGGLAGGAIGGAIGGFVGPTVKGMAKRAGGDVFLGVDENGMAIITGARGKRWDEAGSRASVQAAIDSINREASDRELRFAAAGQSAVGFGQASGSQKDISGAGWVAQLRSENENQQKAFETLAARGVFRTRRVGAFGNNAGKLKQEFVGEASLEDAFKAADFVVQVFEPMGKAEEKTSAFVSALKKLNDTYDDVVAQARDLGLAETDLQAQRAVRIAKLEADRARDLNIIDRTLAARRAVLNGDNRGATLTQFDLRAEAELRGFKEQLFQYGLEETGDEYRRRVVALEQTIADERLAVMRQFDNQMRGITQGLLESLTMGDLGGLPLEARYGAALSSLSAAQRPLLDGATPEELAEFARVAQIALPIAKEFLGVSGSFAELVADVARTLNTAAPGSDPANLSALLEAQVAGADRLELAVIGTGQAQTEVLRNLLSELRRLTAQNEALLARASV